MVLRDHEKNRSVPPARRWQLGCFRRNLPFICRANLEMVLYGYYIEPGSSNNQCKSLMAWQVDLFLSCTDAFREELDKLQEALPINSKESFLWI